MNNKPVQEGMDFPHDLQRQGKKPAQQRMTPPKPTKKDRKRMAVLSKKKEF